MARPLFGNKCRDRGLAALIAVPGLQAAPGVHRYDADCQVWELAIPDITANNMKAAALIHAPSLTIVQSEGSHNEPATYSSSSFNRERSARDLFLLYVARLARGQPLPQGHELVCVVKGTEGGFLAASINAYVQSGLRQDVSLKVAAELRDFLKKMKEANDAERTKLINELLVKIEETPPQDLPNALRQMRPTPTSKN